MFFVSQIDLVCSAIKSLGYYATACDVAVKAGIGINEANTALNKLAGSSGAILKVSEEGTIFYDFSGKQIDADAGAAVLSPRLIGYWRCLCYIGFFCIRVSFGLILLSPALLVVLVIAFAIFSVLAMAVWFSDHFMLVMGLSGAFLVVGGTLGEDIGRFFGRLPFSWLQFNGLKRFFSFETRELASCFEQTAKDGLFASTLSKKLHTGFANDVFAYAFGPGISEKYQENVRWNYVAQLLVQNKGAVIEEQLAPYTANYVNDGNDIFKVLVKFDGRPQVTKNGNIIYLFPNLDLSAWETLNGKLPSYFQEAPKLFAGLDGMQLLRIYSFSLFNLFVAYWLEQYGIHIEELQNATWFIHCFSAYAVLFFSFPLVRLALVGAANSYIGQRNRYRSLLADLLVNPEKEIRLKLKDQAKYAYDSCKIMPTKIEYSTAEEISSQE